MITRLLAACVKIGVMTQYFTPQIIEYLIDALSTQGYAVVPNFMAVEPLAQRARALQQAGFLNPASTGKQSQRNAEIRGDATFWLPENSENAAEQNYLKAMHTLQTALNRSLYLGLHRLECHFAIYPAGAFYKKHLDQFALDHAEHGDVRQLSCILYLNEHWQADDGGQLHIYLDETDPSKTLDVLPEGGTLVLFLSSRFYHEVLPAKRERLSLTGWFKTRGNRAF